MKLYAFIQSMNSSSLLSPAPSFEYHRGSALYGVIRALSATQTGVFILSSGTDQIAGVIYTVLVGSGV
jgi:hypothetical protein